MCSRPEFKWGLSNKGHNRLLAMPVIWRFEHHAAWQVYLTLATKGSLWSTPVFKHFGMNLQSQRSSKAISRIDGKQRKRAEGNPASRSRIDKRGICQFCPFCMVHFQNICLWSSYVGFCSKNCTTLYLVFTNSTNNKNNLNHIKYSICYIVLSTHKQEQKKSVMCSCWMWTLLKMGWFMWLNAQNCYISKYAVIRLLRMIHSHII